MRGKLFMLASVVSLLLCMATGVLWVRSYRAGDIYQSHFDRLGNGLGGRDELWLMSDVGSVIYMTNHWWTDDADSVRIFKHTNGRLDKSYSSHPRGALRNANVFGPTFLGFRYKRIRTDSPSRPIRGTRALLVVVPYWAICSALAISPLIWLSRYCRQRRNGVGVCRHCGYDLRATPERCPECGAQVPKKPEARA